MMVIFISECKKKAIRRTQLVLDSFANRIGSRTWQTVITQEGLVEVKRLLSKTASKNTSVSCLWQRSRIYSQLLWIVGNKDIFNSYGMVAVNSTSKEFFMDLEDGENMVDNKKDVQEAVQEKFYANSPNKQDLAEHLFAVGFVAKKLFEKAIGSNKEKKELAKAVFLAGCLHDIGKVQSEFQDYILKKDKLCIYDEDNQHIDIDNYDPKSKNYFDENIRHNELSLLIFNFFKEHFNISYDNKSVIEHAIYWHHAKTYRNNDKETLEDLILLVDKNLEKILRNFLKVIDQIKRIEENYSNEKEILDNLNLKNNIEFKYDKFKDYIAGKKLPEFKKYKDVDKIRDYIKINAEHNLVRSCIVSADRLVSEKSGDELCDLIANKKLITIINKEQDTKLLEHLEKFCDYNKLFPPTSNRTIKQNKVAEDLASIEGYSDIVVLRGPAGCGKTRIALVWAKLKKAKNIIWVCPRVQICQSIFEELTKDYLPDVNIEIFTGEFKYINKWDNETHENEYFSSDIIITTIDQVLNFIRSHTKVDILLDYMNAHIVFDEFHEYINMEIFNLLFAELIETKRLNENKNILLVSATPHYLYLKEILDIEDSYIENMTSFNESKYSINFKNFSDENLIESPFFKKYDDKKTFIISNNIRKAQLGFLYNYQDENSILFHSKFKKSDKKSIFNKVIDSFKKDGTNQFQILRSGPIIQASLNVSCDYMVSEISTAENILQRLGRLDRFGENKRINDFDILHTEAIKTELIKGKSANFLNKQNIFKSTIAWYKYLRDQLCLESFHLNDIYKIYKDFYKDEKSIEEIRKDLNAAIGISIKSINKKVIEPIKLKKSKSNDNHRKISKKSLRYNNDIYVQLVNIDLNNRKHTDYACHPDDDSRYLTYQYSFLDADDKEILSNMEKYYFEIFNDKEDHPLYKTDKKIIISNKLFFNKARDPRYPIHLSYTKDDLKKANLSEKIEDLNLYYYGEVEKQAIGIISKKDIKFLKDQNNE